MEEENIIAEVDNAWKSFWAKRGIVVENSGRTSLPLWYKRKHFNEDCSHVPVNLLEPEELIARVITRKKVLRDY